jgi:phosphoesterase RecJ-like protein
LSFRSKGAVDVNAFSRAHWNGGGHTHAAGGSAEGNLAEILPMLRRTITDYLHA